MRAIKTLVATAVLLPSMALAEAGPVLAADGGRFVFGQISNLRRDQFMLDTATGRLWVLNCSQKSADPADCKGPLLEPVEYLDKRDIGGDFNDTPPDQTTAARPAKPKN